MLFLSAGAAGGAVVSLEDAVDRALRRTARGEIIQGNVEVAEGLYQAQRINFYVPTISLLGSLPSYAVDESYRFFGGSTRKRLYTTKGLGLNSFIQLEQSLLTGGKFSAKANLTASEDRYPDTDPTAPLGRFLQERSRRGFFDFSVEQPLLRPSRPRNDLADRRDDLEIARLTRRQDETRLRREVTEAYLGLLKAALVEQTAADKLESSRLQAEVDSSKWRDGVVSEEDWLSSASRRLDAELFLREASLASAERRRDLALLLDLENPEEVQPVEPADPEPPTEEQIARWRAEWDGSREVRLAAHVHSKAKRAAGFSARGHGLTGDFRANYTFGRGQVKIEGEDEDRIRTNGWGVALDFTYPVWDGGASASSVRASRFEAERARLELEKAKQAARAEVHRLIDQLEVSGRRLEILKKQIDLAADRLEIALERFDGGRITRRGLLEAKVALLEARGRLLDERITYEVNRIELAGRFGE